MSSPKSAYGKGIAFGTIGKYGVAGMSYQQFDNIRKPKQNSSSKLNF